MGVAGVEPTNWDFTDPVPPEAYSLIINIKKSPIFLIDRGFTYEQSNITYQLEVDSLPHNKER